ncbi:hypothetical protein F2Q69_00005430 [Brassica cretica]|uniref:Uncharacterized protein n=1 Tax=Brassica cretica TaxID=69181 RepID=A0A8S9P4G5_BRACR|nr:hypothetical protein F2Q69_00005430 [Brassica cretica]
MIERRSSLEFCSRSIVCDFRLSLFLKSFDPSGLLFSLGRWLECSCESRILLSSSLSEGELVSSKAAAVGAASVGGYSSPDGESERAMIFSDGMHGLIMESSKDICSLFDSYLPNHEDSTHEITWRMFSTQLRSSLKKNQIKRSSYVIVMLFTNKVIFSSREFRPPEKLEMANLLSDEPTVNSIMTKASKGHVLAHIRSIFFTFQSPGRGYMKRTLLSFLVRLSPSLDPSFIGPFSILSDLSSYQPYRKSDLYFGRIRTGESWFAGEYKSTRMEK